jgi:DNA-binding response OmpR family regulator
MNKIKVLVADSAASVRQFIRYTLEDHFRDVEFEIATNGKNIQKRIESSSYELILYDSAMPFLSGYELLKWLKNSESFKNISFILLSSKSDEASLKKAAELGADAYLVKPLLMETLVNKVKEILSGTETKNFDRRKKISHKVQGTIEFKLDGKTCSGRIMNIGTEGLLASFAHNEDLPRIMSKVVVSVELENKRRIEELEGRIVRIQVVDTLMGSDFIQFGVKFSLKMNDKKKKELLSYILSIKN